VQLSQQSFKPARVSTRFHSHTHFPSLRRQLSVELLRFLTVLQRPFLDLSSIGIHKRNLLETRVVICSYNDHCPAPFYPSLFGWSCHHQAYSGLGAGIVMESITQNPSREYNHQPGWRSEDKNCCRRRAVW